MTEITALEVIDKYENIFLDAFGVLANAEGAIEFAPEFIDTLNAKNKNYYVVSNGSKFLPEKSAESYRKRGLSIPDERVITSGSLLFDWYKENPEFKTTKLLGPSESADLLNRAGAKITDTEDFSTLVICNQDGFKFPEDVDSAISQITKKIKAGEAVKLVLPNPDLIYPSKAGFGITSGSIAIMIEKALEICLPEAAPKFEMLGKPYAPIFNKALSLSNGSSCMIGDQYETDIYGANQVGIDSILVETGICTEKMKDAFPAEKHPKFILKNLEL
jgi:HAD superfamily hydrolase (TIGR01450 family)